MQVRFLLDLGGGTFRPGEVVDLPADTARAFTLAGYAVEVLGPIGPADDQDDTPVRPPAGE